MEIAKRRAKGLVGIAALAGAISLSSLAAPAFGQEVRVALSGGQEIPPVTTTGAGTGIIAVAADRGVTASVTVSGMAVTVAHIHEAPAGSNGPIVVPLVKTSDNTWAVPPGTKLTPAQYDAFKAGNLYFNVHSDAHKAGEIRGQIKP
ncbi:MAG: CHRD domain-containing protein [Burkholderiales bacterium]